MITIRKGSKNEQVRAWQHFLIGRDTSPGTCAADGVFGVNTFSTTCTFQHLNDLGADGIVGQQTYAAAVALGYSLCDDGAVSPLKPLSKWAKWRKFGRIKWVPYRTSNPSKRDLVVITNGWEKRNIVSVRVPQLSVARSGRTNIRVHKKVAEPIVALWNDWYKAELMHHVKTWHGSYVSRLVRGSTKTLSNHCYGTAFDINARWNRLGHVPAAVGAEGSVRELVAIAEKHGFYWGGNYKRRPDGMHFEWVGL